MRCSVVLFGLVSAALAGGPALAQAPQAIDLEGRGLNLNMSLTASQPDGPQAGGSARLTGQLSRLQTRVEVGVQTGQAAPAEGAQDNSGWWNATSANVGATWTPFGAARIELDAQNATRVDYTASDPVFGDASQQYAQRTTSGAKAAATLTPFAPLELTFGAAVSSELEQTAAIAGSGVETRDQVLTQQRLMSAGLAWKPLSAISLEVGGKVQATSLQWAGGRAASPAIFDPNARLSLKPWSRAAVDLTLDRTTTPLSQAQFLGYGEGAADALPAAVQPSREWRYGATVTQKAGPVELSASLIQARVRSFDYLAPSLGARVGVAEGDRREVQTRLGAPLPLFGLAPFRLEAQATWRGSAVQDPLTGALGRLSGERPYDASVSLSHGVGAAMLWGVTAKAAGPQVNLGPTAVANLSSTAGLGGFVQYQSRPVTLRLSLDNLVGGEHSERDVTYDGLRDLGVVDRTTALRTVDRRFHISLIRPL